MMTWIGGRGVVGAKFELRLAEKNGRTGA